MLRTGASHGRGRLPVRARWVAAAACALAVGLPTAASAQSVAKVGPRQSFRALVNGRTGSAAPVVIRMGCAGPVLPGATGHPLAGQSVKVALGAATATDGGFTGSGATSIGVFFGPPPPAAAASTGLLTLDRYGVARPIPTSITLPCSGTGHVTFVPLPMSPPTSRAAVVNVTFVGQP